MRKEAATSPGLMNTDMMNDENMTDTASRRESREGHMYSGHIYNERPTHAIRRFTLGVALAVLGLMLAPTLVDQYSVQASQQVVRESAAAPALPAAAAQEVAPAPAAFSDALAAAPAGAQCSVAAHSCSVPADDGASAMSSSETAVAYGFSQSARSANHNQRM